MSEREQHLSHSDASGEASGAESSLTIPYLLGELSSAEESVFEQGLHPGTQGAQDLEDSMEALTLLAEQIASTMPAPRRALRDRVLAEVHSSAATAPSNGLPYDHLLRQDEGEWFEEPGAPGIQVKILFEDKRNKYYTVLARIGAGVHYPAHRHVGREQCYVISGDLHVNDVELHGGDYITTDDGTEHALTYSNEGCLLLLTTRLADEMLAA